METYGKVINTVVRNRRKKPMTKSNKSGNSNKSWQTKTNNNSAAPILNFAMAEGGTPAKPAVLHCRFCNVNGHSNLHCPNYLSCEDRIKKCKELKICFHCSSLKHDASACPGLQHRLYRACKFCGSKQHIAALCSKRAAVVPNVIPKPTQNYACLTTNVGQKSNFLLPVLSITMQGRGGEKITFNALFDTASSRSYINPKVA